MPPVAFAQDIKLDGLPWKARRIGPAQRDAVIDFIPQVAGQEEGIQLDPVTETTWHRGSGASRKVVPGMHAYAPNAWTCDPGYVTGGPAVTAVALPTAANGDILAWVEQDGHLYTFGGQYGYRIPNGSGAPVMDQDLGAGAQAVSAVPFKSSFFVGVGLTVPIWQKSAGGAWTNVATGVNPVYRGQLGTVFWTVGGLTGQKLVGQVGSTGLLYLDWTKDPRKDADWTPANALDVGSIITGLVATRDHIYPAAQDGLHDLDNTGLAPNLTPEVAAFQLATNGQALLAAKGWIYYGSGYGLLRVRVTNPNEYAQIQDVTPMADLPNETPVAGLPLACTRYRQYIILAQYDANSGVAGGTTYVSWGRESLGGYGQYAEKAFSGREIGPMVWNCSPIVLPGLKVTSLHVSGLVAGDPRLWMGVTDSGGVRSLRWAQLPIQTWLSDVRRGRTVQFTTSWDLIEPAEDWGDDTMPKLMPDLAIEADSLGAGSSVQVQVAADGSSLFNPIGTLQSSPSATLTPSSEVKGNRLQVKYTVTQLPAGPVFLRKTSKRAIPRPDLREVRSYQLLIGRSLRHQGGGTEGLDPVQRRKALVNLKRGGAVSFVDEDGQAFRVMVAGRLRFSEVEADVNGQGERVLAANVNCAIIEPVGQPFNWDSGVPWDSGRSWS